MSKIFNSVSNAVSLEKSTEKTVANLVKDFMFDITANNAESVKKALKTELKKAGFTPSNCFSMKAFNSAVAIAAAGIDAEDAAAVISFLKIKPSRGEKMTAATIAAAVEKYGNLSAVIAAAKEAATPAAKKAAKTAAAKKGAATRVAAKSAIVPQAVRAAAQDADSVKNAESPRQQAATPAARLDRAINAFLALDDDGKAAFYAAVRRELNAAVINHSKMKKKKAA